MASPRDKHRRFTYEAPERRPAADLINRAEFIATATACTMTEAFEQLGKLVSGEIARVIVTGADGTETVMTYEPFTQVIRSQSDDRMLRIRALVLRPAALNRKQRDWLRNLLDELDEADAAAPGEVTE
jgi:hypothetical protein